MILVASWLTGIGPFHGGYVGLDVGFVIAGFFASRHVTERINLAPRPFFIDVVAYRLRRIVPLTALISILTGGFIIVVYGYANLDSFMAEARSVILFYTNFQSNTGSAHPVSVRSSASPFAQFWTISLLQQLVLAWAALYYYAHRRASEKVVRSIFWAAIAIAILASGEIHYYSVTSSVLAFAIGAMYSWYHDRSAEQALWWHDALAALGVVYIFGAAILLNSHHHYSGAVGAGIALSTVAIISAWAPDGAGVLERIFEFRPLSYLGRYTFAFYLWLFPGLVILAHARDEVLSTSWRLLVIIGAAALAFLSHHFIEVPILRWLDPEDDRVRDELDFKITYRGTAILVTIAVVMSFGFANMSHYKAVTAFKAPPPTALELAFPSVSESPFYPTLRELKRDMRKIAINGNKVSVGGYLPGESNLADDADSQVFADCTARGNDSTVRACHVGDPKAKPSILVIGDGLAVSLAASLQPLAAETHVSMFVAARHGCRNNSVFDSFDNPRAQACATWHKNLSELIRKVNPDVIVLSSAEHNPRSGGATNEEWGNGHQEFTDKIQSMAKGVRLIDVGGWVYRKTDPVACLHVTKSVSKKVNEKVTKSVGSCATRYSSGVNSARVRLRHQSDQKADIAFINVSKYFCIKKICPAIVGGVATMANVAVPSQSYMRYITRAFEPELSKIGSIARQHYAQSAQSPPK